MEKESNEKQQLDELLDSVNKVYGEQTSNCSEICRKIVFALLALVWLITYSDSTKELSKDPYCILVFIFLVLYLIIDIIQYLFTAISYRRHFYKTQDAVIQLGSFKVIKDQEFIKHKKISDRSFKFLILKISLLPIIFVGVIIILLQHVG